MADLASLAQEGARRNALASAKKSVAAEELLVWRAHELFIRLPPSDWQALGVTEADVAPDPRRVDAVGVEWTVWVDGKEMLLRVALGHLGVEFELASDGWKAASIVLTRVSQETNHGRWVSWLARWLPQGTQLRLSAPRPIQAGRPS